MRGRSVLAVVSIAASFHLACASEPRRRSEAKPTSPAAASASAVERASAPELGTPTSAPLPIATASASTSTTAKPAPPTQPRTLDCRCDVIGFESDGPPASRCTWVQAADGGGTWTSETGRPKFSAKLTPIVRAPGAEPRAVDYVFEGDFDFECKQRWCGRQHHKILRVRDNDFRVTVDRSDEGPPRRVLWFTCEP